MDQHPIPQDVTGFQFKLIGTMTVKQFGFVASGVVMAVVLYYMPLNTPFAFLIKLLLIPLLGAGGVVIAFVPIDGRPIDVMATNFVKALFSPNQYVYHRQGRKLSFSTVNVIKAPVVQKNAPKTAAAGATAAAPTIPKPSSANKEEQLRALLMSSRGGVKNDLDKKEVAFLKNFAPVTAPAATTAAPAVAPKPIAPPAPATPTPVKAIPTPQPITAPTKPVAPVQTTTPVQVTPPTTPAPAASPAAPSLAPQKETSESLATKETELEKELAQAKQEETTAPTSPAAHQKVTTLEKQIADIHSQKLQLEQELNKLKTQLSEQKNPTPQPAAPAPMAAQASAPTPPAPAPVAQPAAGPVQDPAHVRTISQEVSKKIGLPKVSDTPNVVLGIVKDPRGNVLSNILVEVKDKEGNPVRAFKTNPLGQFASATPLSPGTYTMELEDPKKQQRFDVIQIIANNQIMPPIEVISHDAREELRQQLFAS